ncbi:MAG: helix-turn-helix domain-containing protein [Acidobacteriota bacterium]
MKQVNIKTVKSNKTRGKLSSRRVAKKKEEFMSEDDFAELETSLKEALAHARGERDDLRTTVREVPPMPRPRSRASIVALRRRLNYSQSMFARALNVSTKTVQAWEQGLRTPSDAALKLLAIAEKHPEVLLDSE